MSKRRRSSGEGSIYQRKDGKWVSAVEVGERGDRRKRRFVGKTREEVRQKLIAAQRDGVERGPRNNIDTIADLADEWLKTTERSIAHRTHASYKDVVEAYIKPTIGRIRKRELTPANVEGVLRRWIKMPRRDNRKGSDGKPLRLSSTTLRYNLTVLNIMLNWAVKMREITYNPALPVEPPAAEEYESEVLTPEEFADLLTFAQRWHTGDRSTHILVAAATGMRRGELCGLQRDDIDVENDEIVVARAVEVRRDSHALALKTPKGKKAECIAVPRLVTEALIAWFAEQDARLPDAGPDTPVFDTTGGLSHPDTFGKDIFNLIRKWGVKRVRLHDLRHSFGSWNAIEGTSDRVLRAQLRHKSQKMTDKYTTHVDAAQRQAADALDRRLRVAMAQRAAENVMGHSVGHQAIEPKEKASQNT